MVRISFGNNLHFQASSDFLLPNQVAHLHRMARWLSWSGCRAAARERFKQRRPAFSSCAGLRSGHALRRGAGEALQLSFSKRDQLASLRGRQRCFPSISHYVDGAAGGDRAVAAASSDRQDGAASSASALVQHTLKWCSCQLKSVSTIGASSNRIKGFFLTLSIFLSNTLIWIPFVVTDEPRAAASCFMGIHRIRLIIRIIFKKKKKSCSKDSSSFKSIIRSALLVTVGNKHTWLWSHVKKKKKKNG